MIENSKLYKIILIEKNFILMIKILFVTVSSSNIDFIFSNCHSLLLISTSLYCMSLVSSCISKTFFIIFFHLIQNCCNFLSQIITLLAILFAFDSLCYFCCLSDCLSYYFLTCCQCYLHDLNFYYCV